MVRHISLAPDEVRASLSEINAGHALILGKISSDGIPDLLADNLRAIVRRLQTRVTVVRESMTAVVESGHQAHVISEVAAEVNGAGETWGPLLEEASEAFAEDDPARLRAELVQVAAVAIRRVAAIDAAHAEAVTR